MTKAKARGIPPTILVLASVLVATGLRAQAAGADAAQAATAAPANAADAPRIDETARKLMRGACEFLQSKNAFSFRGEATFDEVYRTGRYVQRSRGIDYLLKRPDRMRAEVMSDKGRRDFYYDGKAVTISDLDAKVYASFDAPPTIEAMLEDAQTRLGVTMPMADLASAEPCAALQTAVRRAWYLGKHYFAGERYHHLLLSGDDVDLQVWLPIAGPPLFRKLVFTYKNDPGSPMWGVVLSNWNFAPDVNDAKFTYKPSAGTQEIGFVEFAALPAKAAAAAAPQ
jgi:hypothetical protein